MEIFEAFTQYLNNYTPLTAIIGEGVFPDLLPQGRANGIVYTPLPNRPNYHLSGFSSLENATFQFATYAKSNKEAFAISKLLKRAFSEIPGQYGDICIQFAECIMENEKFYESDTKLHSYKSDFVFNFNR